MLLLVAGCAPNIDGCSIFPPNGLAGNGSFQYDCAGADPECDDRAVFEIGGELPTHPIARGSSFRLSYLSKARTVQPVSKSAVSAGRNGAFIVNREGSVGFFVDADEPGQIEDAVRLRVAEADRILVARVPAPFGETERVGSSVVFRATSTAKGETLAGALPATWEIDDGDVAELDATPTGSCTLRALKPGKVKLRARFGELTDQLEVVFAPAAEPSDAGTDSSSDAQTEAGDASID